MSKNQDKKNKLLPLKLVLSMFLISASACQQTTSTDNKSTSTNKPVLESQLILSNASLEQAKPSGERLWKIKAEKTVYSQDKKKAYLENLTGNFYQDEKIILEVKAEKGEIEKDGEKIILRDNIVATDPRNGAVLRADELEWYREQNLVIIRKNLNVKHPKLEVWAKEAKYYSEQMRLELNEDVVAREKENSVQMNTEHLWWEIDKEKVIGDKPLQIVRYKDNLVTDEIVAERLIIELDKNRASLKENVQVRSLDPPIQIATNSAIWNYQLRNVIVDQPLKIVQAAEQIKIEANQGKFELEKQIAYLKGGVKAKSERNQAKLYADDLTWNIATQIVEAVGNAVYEQADPKIHLSGVKAVGKLQDNSVVVSGNSNKKVETEIIP